MRKLQVYSVAFVAALGLAACGDDDSDFSALPEKQPDNAVLSIDDLSNCTSKKEGNLEFVKDTPYVCAESDGKYKWIQVSQTEDEPEDFKVCNQKREGKYALASSEDVLYVCSDEEWVPLIQINDEASSSSGKETGSSSSKSKSSDSGKDKGSSGKGSSSSDKGSSSGKGASSSVEKGASSSSGKETGSSSSASKSSDSGKDTESSSSVSSSSGADASSSSAVSSASTPSSFSMGMDESAYDSLQNTLTDYRDGQVYKTTTIEIFNEERGIRYSEVWMAQNLNYAYLADTASFCYDDQPAMCDEYGRYYTWAAAMDSAGVWSEETKGCGYIEQCFPTYPVRGVCPKGWHLPTDVEWNAFIEAVDGARTSFLDRKNWLSVLPARAYGESAGPEAVFWSSKGSGSFKAYHVFFAFPDYIAILTESYKTKAFSVRCIKD